MDFWATAARVTWSPSMRAPLTVTSGPSRPLSVSVTPSASAVHPLTPSSA